MPRETNVCARVRSTLFWRAKSVLQATHHLCKKLPNPAGGEMPWLWGLLNRSRRNTTSVKKKIVFGRCICSRLETDCRPA